MRYKLIAGDGRDSLGALIRIFSQFKSIYLSLEDAISPNKRAHTHTHKLMLLYSGGASNNNNTTRDAGHR